MTSATPTIIAPGLFYFITASVTPDGANTAEWGWQENNLTPMQIGYFAGFFGTPNSFGIANTPCTTMPCTATNDPDASGTPAFTVSGDPIATPKPGTWSMLGTGLLALLVAARKTKAH